MEAVPDGIAGEQTWPTEAEMDNPSDAEAGTLEGAGRLRRKVPEAVRSIVCVMIA